MKIPKVDIRYLYVMYTLSFWWRFKCGIANDVERRRAEIEAGLSSAMNRKVRVRVAASVPSVFSETQEAKIHRWLAPFRDNGMVYHSGYSEWFWFWIPNFALAAVVWAVCYLNGYYLPACYVALITLQPFYPLPAVIIVAGVFVVEVVLVFSGIFVAGVIVYLAYQIFNYLFFIA